MSEADTWETSDLGTAAYAFMRGLAISGVRRQPRGKLLFVFVDPTQRGPKLQVEYVNSESRRFDSAVRSLKKLMH